MTEDEFDAAQAEHEQWLRTKAPNELGGEHYWGWADIEMPDRGVVRDIWWVHRCTNHGGRTALVLGRIDISTGERHELIQEDPLTVHGGSGSILCRDCGDHGWIRDGRWVAA